jgi:predicted Rossmann-fold nucleotide-binding protein
MTPRPLTVPHAAVSPENVLSVLSQAEVNKLCAAHQGPLFETFRRCALAAMTSGVETDNARELMDTFADFEVAFEQVDRGLRVHLRNAPANAFVDGVMIRGIQQQLFDVLRDIVYTGGELARGERFDLATPAGITDAVFHILRHAGLLRPGLQRGVAVCWGGHSIGRTEYEYCKDVGYQLGLRGIDICTGCGPGAMKGPMKGATIAHSKQRIYDGRYIGITEPGIIAAEAPNPIVNELVIMPDIEKRLEAFIRLGHGIVVFPGGVGTAEEILYLLGVLAHPDNAEIPFPFVMTGPAGSAGYFELLDGFIREVLGEHFARRYEIIVDDPSRVATRMRRGIDEVLQFRDDNDDAAYFNWLLHVDSPFQQPFVATHEAMAGLRLDRGLPVHELASNLRRAFSGLVSGNVKEDGIRAVERDGPFELCGEQAVIGALDELLRQFVAQGRMRLAGRPYTPCYRLAG